MVTEYVDKQAVQVSLCALALLLTQFTTEVYQIGAFFFFVKEDF
jgi:hypothetical protein